MSSSAVAASATGTETVTLVEQVAQSSEVAPTTKILTLILREEKPSASTITRVTWTEDTVNNEHLKRKSSKSMLFSLSYDLKPNIYPFVFIQGCCIFHKIKKFGESDSDESDSDVEEAKKTDSVKGESKVKNYQRFHA